MTSPRRSRSRADVRRPWVPSGPAGPPASAKRWLEREAKTFRLAPAWIDISVGVAERARAERPAGRFALLFPLSTPPPSIGTILQMADSVWAPASRLAMERPSGGPRHSAMVRATHWVTTLCFLALLISGVEILVSHPRFYWGEAGNVLTPPLFTLPIPASRDTVPTGYGYVLPDQNGWSRYLHFESAWVAVLTGLLYIAHGLWYGHFRENLLPSGSDLSRRGLASAIGRHLHLRTASEEEARSYNPVQRLTYLLVIFVLFPLAVWTGLAMSPAIASVFPGAVIVLGGQQSARTIHFFVTVLLVIFLLVHIAMVCLAGFRNRVQAMITGRLRG
jgi:thiosulfate reductase cytochrome b subunit